MLKQIMETIQQYDNIVIYRHVNPDYDAFGSQFGMYHLIKSNFPDKTIYLAGEMISRLTDLYDYDGNYIACPFDKATLGIVVDTANRERIDGDDYIKCDKLIKIDHHPVVDSYGDINFEDPEASSCSQMVTELLKLEGVDINKEGANALYLGIVGDTNRFMYSATNQKTFEAAIVLLNYGIDIQDLYEKMYLETLKDLEIRKFILNHFVVDGSIGYFVLKQEDLDKLQITRQEASHRVGVLANIEEIEIWMSVTENIDDKCYRVSLRSRHYPINTVADQYRGGGHQYASGATLLSLDELNPLINDLKQLIEN